MILGFIPFLFFALCVLFILQFYPKEKDGIDVRVVIVTACIISSVWLVVGTELLSLFSGISFWPVLLWWTAPSVGMAIFVVWRRQQLAKVHLAIPTLEALDWALLIPTIILFISVGLSAWFSAPNNWDSMVYHLPRQVYWIQHQTVEHYPAALTLQLLMPPFSEFMGMHLMLLSGGDRWANMVQFFSFAMLMVIVSLIARDLGARKRGQILAAFLVSSAPTIYIYASNTKNDVVLALWVCLLAWFALRIFIDRDHGMVRVLLVGATLGLALLTKGTGYFFVPASCILIGIGIVRSTRRFAKPAAVITICAILLNSGHWVRNFRMFGSPIGYDYHMHEDVNKAFGPEVLASNIIRNITLHLGTPGESFNRCLEQAVYRAHALLGVDPQDRRITLNDNKYEVFYRPHLEDSTPSGMHVILIWLTLILALPFYHMLPKRLLCIYLAIPCLGFVLFCLMLQWTPWHSRMHISLLCLFMPAAAVMLTQTPGRLLVPFVMVGILVTLFPTVIGNYRPLLGEHSVFKTDRTSQMFYSSPNLLAASVAVADLVAEVSPRSVGLGPGWEYPLQRLILDRMETPPAFCSFDARLHEPQVKSWPIDPEPPEMVILMDRIHLLLRDKPSKMKYGLVACIESYGVYVQKDLSDQIDFRGTLSPFFGWTASEGLLEQEGPYPKWGLPIVRWGGGTRTRIIFQGDGHPLVLVMTCGKHHLEWQEITILLNGEQIGRYRFDIPDEFKEIKHLFIPRNGRNVLTIEYQNQDDTFPGKPMALLFKQIQIVWPKMVGRGYKMPEQ